VKRQLLGCEVARLTAVSCNFFMQRVPENNLRLAKRRKLPALSRSHGVVCKLAKSKRANSQWIIFFVKISTIAGKRVRVVEFCSSSASGRERIVVVVVRQAIKVGYYHSMRCE
jgi:hypothetical protein